MLMNHQIRSICLSFVTSEASTNESVSTQHSYNISQVPTLTADKVRRQDRASGTATGETAIGILTDALTGRGLTLINV